MSPLRFSLATLTAMALVVDVQAGPIAPKSAVTSSSSLHPTGKGGSKGGSRPTPAKLPNRSTPAKTPSKVVVKKTIIKKTTQVNKTASSTKPTTTASTKPTTTPTTGAQTGKPTATTKTVSVTTAKTGGTGSVNPTSRSTTGVIGSTNSSSTSPSSTGSPAQSAIKNYYSSIYYGLPYSTSRPFSQRSGYHQARYYPRSVHHSRRHRRPQQYAVRGIVVNTTGQGKNGTVQIHVLPLSDTQFRYPKPKNGAQTAPLHNYHVNNSTRYQIVVGNQGATRNGNFNNLQVGDPIILLTRQNPYNRNNLNNNANNANNNANNANNNANVNNANNGIASGTANAIEVFHKKQKQQVAQAAP